jgi:hypothetical protein
MLTRLGSAIEMTMPASDTVPVSSAPSRFAETTQITFEITTQAARATVICAMNQSFAICDGGHS